MSDNDTTLEEVEQLLETAPTQPIVQAVPADETPTEATSTDEPDIHLMGPVQAHVTDREDLRITRTYCPVLPDLPEHATTRAAELEPRPEPELVPGLEIPSGPLLFAPR